MKSQTTTRLELLLNYSFSSFLCIIRLTSSPPSSLLPAGPGIPQTTLHRLSEINGKFLTNLHQSQSLVVGSCPLSVWGGHTPQSISFFLFFHLLINPLRFWVLESSVELDWLSTGLKITGTKQKSHCFLHVHRVYSTLSLINSPISFFWWNRTRNPGGQRSAEACAAEQDHTQVGEENCSIQQLW